MWHDHFTARVQTSNNLGLNKFLKNGSISSFPFSYPTILFTVQSNRPSKQPQLEAVTQMSRDNTGDVWIARETTTTEEGWNFGASQNFSGFGWGMTNWLFFSCGEANANRHRSWYRNGNRNERVKKSEPNFRSSLLFYVFDWGTRIMSNSYVGRTSNHLLELCRIHNFSNWNKVEIFIFYLNLKLE